VPEGSEEAAGKLLRDDVVLLVPLAGAEGWCSVGSTARPNAAELELAGAVGDNARVRKNEIGWVSELQGVAAVL
jgi:hypothetical protein